MRVCVIVFVASAVAFLYFKIRGFDKAKQSMCGIVCIFCLLGMLIDWKESKEKILGEDNKIQRNEHGEGDYTVSLEMNIQGIAEDEKFDIEVKEKCLSTEEENSYIQAAIGEIEDSFIGENASVNDIYQDVVMLENYQNGFVEAVWYLNDHKRIETSGEIHNEDVPEEGELQMITVKLICEDSEVEYSFYIRILPKIKSEMEVVMEKLNEELTNQSEKSELILPDKVNGHEVTWSEKDAKTAEKVMFFGVVIAFFIPMIRDSKKKEAERCRVQKLDLEYTGLINMLTLLLGSGMTVMNAWKKIATSDKEGRKKFRKEKSPLIQEMQTTLYEIESGIGEVKAIEHFGERCMLPKYRKFSNLLSQNLRKGTREIIDLLEKEAEMSNEERKNCAKKLGEEASTKMLIPMMIMFGIVVAVIMVPAFTSFQLGG